MWAASALSFVLLLFLLLTALCKSNHIFLVVCLLIQRRMYKTGGKPGGGGGGMGGQRFGQSLLSILFSLEVRCTQFLADKPRYNCTGKLPHGRAESRFPLPVYSLSPWRRPATAANHT